MSKSPRPVPGASCFVTAMLGNRFPELPPVSGEGPPSPFLTLRFCKFRERRFTEVEETCEDWLQSLCSSKPTGWRSSQTPGASTLSPDRTSPQDLRKAEEGWLFRKPEGLDLEVVLP